MLKDLETRLQYQGLTLEKYFQFTNTNEEEFRNQMNEVATNKVKTEMVIDKIAEVEKDFRDKPVEDVKIESITVFE